MFGPEDDDDVPRSRHECVDCKSLAPPTNTNYTLISASFGWRLTRGVAADGLATMEWRCPSCWEAHKRAARGSLSGETPTAPHAAKPPSEVPASGTRRAVDAQGANARFDASKASSFLRGRRSSSS
ncbi:MAG: hypothetical protein JWM74_806 [Myxococcaceae bacterium]|nr:hypothetical protein [Myxococcaceae bacterium]